MIDQKIIKIASKSKFYGLKKQYTHMASFKNNIELMYKFFKDDKLKLPKKFQDLKGVFKKKYFARSECIMLPYNALLKAVKER